MSSVPQVLGRFPRFTFILGAPAHGTARLTGDRVDTTWQGVVPFRCRWVGTVDLFDCRGMAAAKDGIDVCFGVGALNGLRLCLEERSFLG